MFSVGAFCKKESLLYVCLGKCFICIAIDFCRHEFIGLICLCFANYGESHVDYMLWYGLAFFRIVPAARFMIVYDSCRRLVLNFVFAWKLFHSGGPNCECVFIVLISQFVHWLFVLVSIIWVNESNMSFHYLSQRVRSDTTILSYSDYYDHKNEKNDSNWCMVVRQIQRKQQFSSPWKVLVIVERCDIKFRGVLTACVMIF